MRLNVTAPAPADSAETYLSLTGLTADYDGVRVLHGVDFSLRKGEAVAVLGRNGAGKSTLAAALFNLGPQLGGHVRVKGQDVTDWPSHRIARLGAALVPQGRGVFADLTVDENLTMAALWSRRLPARRWVKEQVYEALPRLAERRGFLSGSLSGGERQLLAIARALLTQADLIIMDEPSEGLSLRAIEDVIIGTVGRLRDEGYTLLIAEQNSTMALRLASRVLLLDHGKVVFDGTSEELARDAALQREHLGL